ncbi:PH domain-containing protein, partial [Schumannella luteola]
PLLKGGIALLAILGIIVSNLRERLIEWIFPAVDCPPGVCDEDPFTLILDRYLLPTLLGILVLLVVILGLFWMSWRMHTFRVTEEIVEVRAGVLFRSHRRSRLDRVQGINVSRPLFARLFGAARLEISAAGSDANVQLAYLSSANADGLRAEILRRASGIRAREAAQSGEGVIASVAPDARANLADVARQRIAEFSAPELDPALAPPQSVVTMHAGRLVGSTLLSVGMLWFLVAIAGVAVAMALTGAGV